VAAERKYWFPAKRYGWGWGPPTTWQGWVVLLVFLALICAGVFLILPREGPAVFVVYSLVLTALLLAVCWLKGEPPRWRWGRKRDG
jgi:drug/metabolite transporter (DMT)-like permease